MSRRVLESYDREFLKLLGKGMRKLAEQKIEEKKTNKSA